MPADRKSPALRRLSGALALVAPALLLAAAVAWYLRPVPWTRTAWVAAQDELVATHDPDVVVLGSSWSLTNIDDKALAATLHLPTAKVLKLGQARSEPATWYAIEKYRLYAADKHPRLLVVIASIPQLMTLRPDLASASGLDQHFATPDEVLLTKVWGVHQSPLVTRLMNRRSEPRDAALQAMRAAAVGLLSPPPAGTTVAELQAAAGLAVFGVNQGSGETAAHRFLPVAEDDRPAPTAQKLADLRAADTFLADITDLAEAHGARVAVVLGPVAANLASTQVVPLGRERDFVDYANARHIGWIDLRSAAFSDQSFSTDGSHMRPDAAERFSRMVGDRLVALGALEAAPMAAASLVSVAKVERTGTPPALDAPAARATPTHCLYRINLGAWAHLSGRAVAPRIGAVSSPVVAWLGETRLPAVNLPQLTNAPCDPGFLFDGAGTVLTLPDGSAPDTLRVALDPSLPDPETRQAATWWVYPGTGVRWTLDGLPDHAVTVEMAVRQLADGPAPTLLVGGAPVTFVDAEEGLLARATLRPGAAPTLELRQEAAGPFLILRRLSLIDAEQTTDLVTRPLARAIDALAEVVERTPPPSLDLPRHSSANGATTFTLPWDTIPGCSPFVVRADDAVVPAGTGKDRRWWAADRSLFVTPMDGAAPTVSLDPHGACGACASCVAWHWMYPGDRIVGHISKARRAALPGALRSIHLRGEGMGGGAPDATITVITRWKDTVMGESTHPVAALAEGVTSVFTDFIPRVEPEPLAVEVQLSANSAPVKVMVQAMPQ